QAGFKWMSAERVSKSRPTVALIAECLWSHDLAKALYTCRSFCSSLKGPAREAEPAKARVPNWSGTEQNRIELQAVRRVLLPARPEGAVDLRGFPLQTAVCWDAPADLSAIQAHDLEEEADGSESLLAEDQGLQPEDGALRSPVWRAPGGAERSRGPEQRVPALRRESSRVIL
ncbi:unnamed protein product, partial [Effrenium voratum]